ncbi:glycosyltransferase [Luminiphilus sp.]|nr:glycosyltransferase [Luminiphilus sp.]
MVDLTAAIAIFPSRFTANFYELKKVKKVVVLNEVDTKIKRAGALMSECQVAPRRPFIVLMLASLKTYKGVYDFFEVSKLLIESNDIIFRLVANANGKEIARFKHECSGSNFEVVIGGGDVTAHLSEAAVVVNMSHPDRWVETFGLTLIEAFCFGVPVIAPDIGGPLDIVTHGEDGFLLHHQQKDVIASKILKMANDHHYWQKLSDNARKKGDRFSDGSMGEIIRKLMLEVQDFVL